MKSNNSYRFFTAGLGAIGLLSLSTAVVLGVAGAASADECPISARKFTPDPEFTSIFLANWCRFQTTGTNPFFVLEPGYQIVLESDEERQVVTVLDKTRVVDGVNTRVVEEREFEKDGKKLRLAEVSRNFFAICRRNNSVFYFGEEVDIFDEDGNVTHEGAWQAGKHGARPGIVMPGTILVGGRYYEEIAPEDSALDKGEIVGIERGCEAGDFEFDRKCLTVEGSSDCSSEKELKVYVAGVGVVVDEDLEIVRYGFVQDDDDDDDDEGSDD